MSKLGRRLISAAKEGLLMTHADQLTALEKEEFAVGWGGEYYLGHMTQDEYRKKLAMLGFNATAVDQWVKDYIPPSHV